MNILFNRYPNVNFYIHCEKKYSQAFSNIDNVNILNHNTPLTLDFANREFQGIIYIAGSVFMQPKDYYEKSETNFKDHAAFASEFKRNKKPFFYISCNFGPYDIKSYYEQSKKYLKLCTDVCFRDKYSFNLFKNLPNVRYAPDAALSWDYSKIKKIKGSVGVSIIEPSVRWYIAQDKKEDYYNFLKNNIIYLINQGKEIYLFSYCEFEGDVVAQKELLEIIPDNYHSKINLLNYEGNLESYLRKYNEMEYALCGRFHSMILSLIFGHKYYVTAYSDKTTNAMNDFKIKNQLLKYEEIDSSEIIPISSYKKINYIKKMFLKYKAKKQFKAFDKWLSKNK